VSSNKEESQGTKRSPSSNTDAQEVNNLRHEGYTPNRDTQHVEDPAFMLDVPVLNVDELELEVNDLRAHVALRAELAELVKINVGVDIYLDEVKLGLKGLEAQALLTIKLDKVLGTLNRALEAIDNNPQILNSIAQDVDQAAGSAGGGVNTDAWETEQAAGDQINETDDEVGRPVQRAEEEAGTVTKPSPSDSGEVEGEEITSNLADLQIEEEYIDEQGRIVARALDESGNMVEEVLNEEGDVLDLSVAAEKDGEPEEEDGGEVDATDAARRKAYDLGVKLSAIKGTGSGGRILVKDVERIGK
jgi:hypothetical protein